MGDALSVPFIVSCPRPNVFPAGVANFGKAMYRSLERSTQDTRNGFILESAQALFSWPRVDLARLRRSYCLISCRAGAWHYRIFPDFLNSGLKMASKMEGKAKVIAYSWNDIKSQITPES